MRKRHSGLSSLRELFGIDLRSLALFRVALGAIVLADLLIRWSAVEELYSDSGVLPRVLLTSPTTPLAWIHRLSGAPLWEHLLFALGAALAVMLAVGYRARTAAFGSWLLAVSLQQRNFYVLNSGDLLLDALLLWAVFLPIGDRFALDARRGGAGGAPAVACSPATVGVLLQFVILYVEAGLLKSGPEWRSEGTAIEMVLRHQYSAGIANELLLSVPELLRWLTPCVVWFETLGPLLLFVPVKTGPIRALLLVAFAGMQIGFGLGLRLQLFPWIATAASLVFVPTWLWERVRVAEARGGDAGPPAPGDPPQELHASGRRRVEAARQGLAALLVVFTLLQAGAGVGWFAPPPLLKRASRALGSYQDLGWGMYSPSPENWDQRVEVKGWLTDGSEVEALAGPPGAADWDRVEDLHASYRFRRYISFSSSVAGWKRPLNWGYLAWLCRQWNEQARPGLRLERASLVYTREHFAPSSAEPVVHTSSHRCSESLLEHLERRAARSRPPG